MVMNVKKGVFAAIHFCLLALAVAGTELFIVLCLTYFRETWQDWLYLSALIAGSVLNAALAIVDIVAYLKRRETLYKGCLTLYAMFVLFLGIFYALIATGFLEIVGDEERLKAYLERAGGWMGFAFTSLQFLQVVVLPIPSTVTVVAGAALFGPLTGSLLSLLGIIVGSLVAFWVGRYAGARVVAWLIGKETLEKWLRKIKGKDKILLTAMFLLPVFPDDVLCFVAGMSSMSVWYFLGVIAVSRVLAIFATSYSITLIPFNTPWGIAVWAVLITLVVVLFVFLYKKSDAILAWFERKFHRETRVEEKKKRGEFTLEVVGPDGAIVSKGVKRDGDPPPEQKDR